MRRSGRCNQRDVLFDRIMVATSSTNEAVTEWAEEQKRSALEEKASSIVRKKGSLCRLIG